MAQLDEIDDREPLESIDQFGFQDIHSGTIKFLSVVLIGIIITCIMNPSDAKNAFIALNDDQVVDASNHDTYTVELSTLSQITATLSEIAEDSRIYPNYGHDPEIQSIVSTETAEQAVLSQEIAEYEKVHK